MIEINEKLLLRLIINNIFSNVLDVYILITHPYITGMSKKCSNNSTKLASMLKQRSTSSIPD